MMHTTDKKEKRQNRTISLFTLAIFILLLSINIFLPVKYSASSISVAIINGITSVLGLFFSVLGAFPSVRDALIQFFSKIHLPFQSKEQLLALLMPLILILLTLLLILTLLQISIITGVIKGVTKTTIVPEVTITVTPPQTLTPSPTLAPSLPTVTSATELKTSLPITLKCDCSDPVLVKITKINIQPQPHRMLWTLTLQNVSQNIASMYFSQFYLQPDTAPTEEQKFSATGAALSNHVVLQPGSIQITIVTFGFIPDATPYTLTSILDSCSDTAICDQVNFGPQVITFK